MAAVGQYQQTLFVSPANGTSPIDADEVRSNDEALRAKHNSHDNDETIHLQSSVAASRPAAGVAGRVWLSTDTLVLGYDNGVSWAGLAYAASTHAHAWGDITSGKPTTLAGYGITDGVNVVNPTTSGTGTHTGGKVTFAATAAGYASVNLPHGTAPSSPANGDLWTTTAGLFARINGVSQTLAPTTQVPGLTRYWHDNNAPGSNVSVSASSSGYTTLPLEAGVGSNVSESGDVLTITDAGWYQVCCVAGYVSGTFTPTSVRMHAEDSGGTAVYAVLEQGVGASGGLEKIALSFVRYFGAGSTLRFRFGWSGTSGPANFRAEHTSVYKVFA